MVRRSWRRGLEFSQESAEVFKANTSISIEVGDVTEDLSLEQGERTVV